jgi:hypothetical protein
LEEKVNACKSKETIANNADNLGGGRSGFHKGVEWSLSPICRVRSLFSGPPPVAQKLPHIDAKKPHPNGKYVV